MKSVFASVLGRESGARIEEPGYHRRLAETVDGPAAETKRNRFFTLALDMLGIADFEGYFLELNPAWQQTLEYTEDQLKSTSSLELVHPDDRAAMAQQLDRLKHGAAITYFEGRYRHKDGSYRWLGWTAAPFVSERLIYIFARDITAAKAAQDQIRQLNQELEKRVTDLIEINKELEAFNYSISHDLRAPLRSIQSFAQVLLQDEAGKLSADGQEYAGRIVRAGRYMDTLLNDLLSYSRLSRTELPPSKICLEALILEVLATFDQEIRDKQASIEIRRPLAVVIACVPTVKQIIGNLVGNALKFIAPDRLPRIRIYTTRELEVARLWVEDNGIGIEPEYHQKIFGLFQRLHPGEAYPGTGVGLALVKKAAERMGGRAGIESQPGKGSRFWVDFPACRKQYLDEPALASAHS